MCSWISLLLRSALYKRWRAGSLRNRRLLLLPYSRADSSHAFKKTLDVGQLFRNNGYVCIVQDPSEFFYVLFQDSHLNGLSSSRLANRSRDPGNSSRGCFCKNLDLLRSS